MLLNAYCRASCGVCNRTLQALAGFHVVLDGVFVAVDVPVQGVVSILAVPGVRTCRTSES